LFAQTFSIVQRTIVSVRHIDLADRRIFPERLFPSDRQNAIHLDRIAHILGGGGNKVIG